MNSEKTISSEDLAPRRSRRSLKKTPKGSEHTERHQYLKSQAGYRLFVSERKNKLSKESELEANQILASQWNGLEENDKKSYHEKASLSRSISSKSQRTKVEVMNTDFIINPQFLTALQPTVSIVSGKEIPKNFSHPSSMLTLSDSDDETAPVNIFTKEFLNYNKKKELQLTQVTRACRETGDLKRVLLANEKSWKRAIEISQEKLNVKKETAKACEERLESKLTKYRKAFNSLKLPTKPNLNIDVDTMAYVKELTEILHKNSVDHTAFIIDTYHRLQTINEQ